MVFTPGPVGLQLEPVAEDPKYGSRVVRFVDGGPKHPGQARKSGIKPGDLVIQAQAENSVATNYEDIIQVLKKSHATRELVFRPVWDASFLETQSSLKLQFQSTSQTPPRNSPSRNAKTPNEVAMSTPVRENTSTAKKLTPFHEESETPLLPRTFGRKEVSSTKRNSNEIRSTLDLNLIHSPSEAVLLSHSFWLDSQPPSEEQERRVEDAHGPTIIPLKSTQESPVSPSSTFIPVTREKPGPLLPGPFSPGTPINHTPNDSIGNSSRSAFTSSSPISNEKVLSESNDSSKTSGNVSLVARNQPSGLTSDVESPTGLCNQRNDPESWSQSLNNLICPETEMNMVLTTPTKTLPQSVRSDASKTTPFSPSKVKELSSTNDEGNWKPKMVSRVFGSLYKTVVPTVASSSYAIGSTVAKKIAPAVASTSYAVGSKVTTKIGEAIVGNSSHDFQEAKKMKLQLLKELSLAKAALDSQDVTKQELEKNMNELFRENVSLRTKFEQEQIRAKVEHVSIRVYLLGLLLLMKLLIEVFCSLGKGREGIEGVVCSNLLETRKPDSRARIV